MSTYRTYAWIVICAAVGGVAAYFMPGIGTAAGIAIGAGIGVAISSTGGRGRRGASVHTHGAETVEPDQTPKNTS